MSHGRCFADEMAGAWRRYYQHWRDMTLDRIDAELIELVPALARLVPPATVIEKHVYSPFFERQLLNLLREHRVDGMVITGTETAEACAASCVPAQVRKSLAVISSPVTSRNTHSPPPTRQYGVHRHRPCTAHNPEVATVFDNAGETPVVNVGLVVLTAFAAKANVDTATLDGDIVGRAESSGRNSCSP
jgi:hypothetical protein